MARTAADCAHLLRAMCGAPPAATADAAGRSAGATDGRPDLAGTVVGVVRADHFPDGSDPERLPVSSVPSRSSPIDRGLLKALVYA
jgi:hypothetical protein